MIDIQPFETDFDAGFEFTATIGWATLKDVVLTFRYDTLEETLRAAKQLSESIDTHGDVDFPTGLVGIKVPNPNRSVIDLLEVLLESHVPLEAAVNTVGPPGSTNLSSLPEFIMNQTSPRGRES